MRRIALLACLVYPVMSVAMPTDTLQRVGQTTLKVMFLKVYDSSLYTEDGRFDGVRPNMALRLKYHRDISSENLVEATRKEWLRQGLYQSALSDGWLEQLAAMWPDISLDDELLLYVNASGSSEFYYNGQAVGTVEDPVFAEHFLSIWLSPETRYPEARNRLVGVDS